MRTARQGGRHNHPLCSNMNRFVASRPIKPESGVSNPAQIEWLRLFSQIHGIAQNRAQSGSFHTFMYDVVYNYV
jgi:hypothetical protein